MLKENSKCAACEKRSRCVQQLMDIVLRDKSKAVATVFDMYESVDCQMEILPFLLEKFDEQLALCAGETREELLRVSGFATRLNALDTVIREADEGEGLSATKRKIAVTLLLGMIDEHRELGPAILSRFYFHSSAALGDLVRDVIALRMEDGDRDADTVVYELTLWHTAEVQVSGRVFDERIVALTAKENDFWESEPAVKVEAVSLVMNHLRVAIHLLSVAYVFLHTIMSRYPGLNRELHNALVVEAETDDNFKLLVRYYDRKRERDMTRFELNGIIGLHDEFQNSLPWEKARALELFMRLFSLCDDAAHAGGYLRRMQRGFLRLFPEICEKIKEHAGDSALFTVLAADVEPLLAVHRRMMANADTLEKFFKKGDYSEDELRALVDTNASLGASAAFTLLVLGREADFAKVLEWLNEKGKIDSDYARAHDDVETRREFIEAMCDHLRRTYGDLIGEEKPVEEESEDVFEKRKGKYLN